MLLQCTVEPFHRFPSQFYRFPSGSTSGVLKHQWFPR